jgi:hypothetical protein
MTAMTLEEELAHEWDELRKAEQDIVEGQLRVDQQHQLMERLIFQGHDTIQAAALLDSLEQTLDAWRGHRSLIQARIDVLERANSGPAPGANRPL